MRRRVQAVALVVVLLVASGCSTVNWGFTYDANRVRGGGGDLKIAVVPFRDLRQSRSDGSHAWNILPLVLFATKYSERRQAPSERLATTWYYPDLVAHTVALDLAASGFGARVDIAPPALEDYDIIVHGSLDGLTYFDRAFAYGLGPLSFLLRTFGFPKGSSGVKATVSYVAYNVRGERILKKQFDREWSSTHWSEPHPPVHGAAIAIRDANRAFAEALAARMAKPVVQGGDVADVRVRSYHERLDPQLRGLVAERDRLRRKDSAVLREFETEIDDEIRRRARYLDSFRLIEDRIISAQQKYVCERQQLRLVQIAKVRAAEGEHEEDEDPRRSAVVESFRQDSGEVALPTIAAAPSRGEWEDDEWRALTDSIVSAMSGMPRAPVPSDLRPLVRELGIEMRGRASAGAVLKGVTGSDIPALREAFLARYARAVRTLDDLKADFVSRRR